MIVPHVVNFGLLFGAITSWGLLYPFLQSKRGQWYHTDSPTSLNGMNGYKVHLNNGYAYLLYHSCFASQMQMMSTMQLCANRINHFL
jgi:hypothetical protein